MKFEDYPPQEPLSDFARPYHEVCMSRAEDVDFTEFNYGEDPYQSVLVCKPEEPTGDVLAFIHGGGWTNGCKEWMAFMAPAVLEFGITFASIGYRLAPGVLWPDGYRDAQDGIAAVYKRVEEFGGKRERFFIGGHSAGGHYSSLMAVTDDWQEARGMPKNAIKGCLPVSGVYDFRDGNGMSTRPRFLGPEGGDAEEKASPIANIQQTPPFLMAWGADDFPHLITQAKAMNKALKAAGGKVTTVELEGCDHLDANLEAGDAEGEWTPPAAKWMAAQK